MTRKRVLVVDDDAEMRGAVARILSEAGYVVEQAVDGDAAVQAQRARPADVVITDVFMPTRDGLETIQYFHAQYPAVPIIAFPRGAGVHYRDFAELTGVEAVSLDTAVPIDWVAREVQPSATVQGNLDPILLVVGGRPMERAARRILDVLNRGPFVFNLGHGILPETPVENVMRLCEIIHKWRA